jgi:hypothetical protein
MSPPEVVLGKFPTVNISLFHGGEQCGNGSRDRKEYGPDWFSVCPLPDNFGQILKMAAPLHQGAGLKPQTKQEASTKWTFRQQGLKCVSASLIPSCGA